MILFNRLLFFALLTVFLVPAASDAAGLKIDRIKIYFSNARPDITVKRNYPLKVFAEIGYTGVGLLEGYWEVDEEFLTNVKRIIAAEKTVVIESPEIPKVPTFVSGTHKVRFIITNPSLAIKFPFAIYFVTTDEWTEGEKIEGSKDVTRPANKKQCPLKDE
jgi:hypothetical protein